MNNKILSRVPMTLMLVHRIKEHCKQQTTIMYKRALYAKAGDQRKEHRDAEGRRWAYKEMLDFIKELEKGEPNMLTTFEMRLTADIDHRDQDANEAFKELLRNEGQILYTQCALMSKTSPSIEITMSNLEEGAVQIELFQDQVLDQQ